MCHLSLAACQPSMHGVRDPHSSQLKYHSVLLKSLRHPVYSALRTNFCCFFFLLDSSLQSVVGSLLLQHKLCFMKPQKSTFGPLKSQLCHAEGNAFLVTLFYCLYWAEGRWLWAGKTKGYQEGSGRRKKIICRNEWCLLNNFEIIQVVYPHCAFHLIYPATPWAPYMSDTT